MFRVQQNRTGFRHEYEFHCLMSGKKRKEDLLCSYDWHSQMYVPIFMHLRERLSRELKNNTEPFQVNLNSFCFFDRS